MAQPIQPSYTELVYEVLRSSEGPLAFQEIVDAVERRRPISTRNPRGTIRNVLGQGKQLVNTGDGRYWYLPHRLRGCLLRLALTETRPAQQPIAVGAEVQLGQRPSFFEAGKRRRDRPVRVTLPAGDEASLTLAHEGTLGWAIPVADPLRRYLIDQHAAAGDALLIRVLDAEDGRGEAWLEAKRRRPEEAIAARNRQLADAAHAYLGAVEGRPIWEIAAAMLARGLYDADVAPDPLGSVLAADPRFDLGGRRTWLGSMGLSFVAVRDAPAAPVEPPPRGASVQVKVTLRGVRPPIWRRLVLPADMRLSRLHDVLQLAMGWTDSHLHQFVVGRRFIGVPSPDDWQELEDEQKIRLWNVAATPRARLHYEYDFGDSWEHDVVVEKVLPDGGGIRAPACLAGARSCPPEDVGGVWGYQGFLEAIRDASHPEHEDMLEWIGGKFDPEAFDPEGVTAALRRLR